MLLPTNELREAKWPCFVSKMDIDSYAEASTRDTPRYFTAPTSLLTSTTTPLQTITAHTIKRAEETYREFKSLWKGELTDWQTEAGCWKRIVSVKLLWDSISAEGCECCFNAIHSDLSRRVQALTQVVRHEEEAAMTTGSTWLASGDDGKASGDAVNSTGADGGITPFFAS